MANPAYEKRPHHLELVSQINHSIPADYAHSRLLLSIAQFCRFDDGTWMAWPSIDTLREACGYKDSRNVRLLLDQLKKLGLISIYRRYRASNIYVLHITKIKAFDPVRAGLRKVKERATSTIKALMKAAKEWLQRKKKRTEDGIYFDHDEAMAAAKAEAKAIAAKGAMTKQQHKPYSGPSVRAREMIAESIRIQLEKAQSTGDVSAIARLSAELATAEAAMQ